MEKPVSYITLTEVVWREGQQFVALSPELDIASCGDTVEQASENLRDATEVYLTTLEQTGQTDRVFQERGLHLHELHKPRVFISSYQVPIKTGV